VRTRIFDEFFIDAHFCVAALLFYNDASGSRNPYDVLPDAYNEIAASSEGLECYFVLMTLLQTRQINKHRTRTLPLLLPCLDPAAGPRIYGPYDDLDEVANAPAAGKGKTLPQLHDMQTSSIIIKNSELIPES